MSLIHIARNNTVLGQFTDAEVAEGLTAGTYLASDLAWRTGMSQWKPLGEWTEFAFSGSVPPPIDQVRIEEEPVAAMPAWEHRREIGLFSALIQTTKEVLRTPDLTFARMPREGGFKNPLLFYMIPQFVFAGIICLFAGLFFAIASHSAPTPGSPEEKIQQLTAGMSGAVIALIYLIGFLIWIPLGLFICAGIQHLLLKLWGACNAPFETTFRTLAYVWGASVIAMMPFQLLGFIPCIGIIFSFATLALTVWSIIVLIKGLAKTHNAPLGRVVGAVLTPILLCCCLYGVMMAIFVTAMAGAASRH